MRNLVSIVMPSYNTGEYIRDSINSVLNQTYPEWELIIVDDCSTDNTDEIIRQFNDIRIRYIKNDKNFGAAVSRNKALRLAKGHWIAFLDSDDLWKPEKLEKQIGFMEEYNYNFTYTNYQEFCGQKFFETYITGPKHLKKKDIYNYCWPGCLTVMYKRDVVGDIQIKNIAKNNDYAMWLNIIEKTDCWLLNENLAFYRKRKGSISNQSYFKLLKWHYKLFHDVMDKSIFFSIYYTFKNIIYGVIKKTFYVRHFH